MTGKNAPGPARPLSARRGFETAGALAARIGGGNITHRLGREIVAGVHPPGARLPEEATMLDRYGVSRTALREAYGKLAAKGMLAARPKVGTSVRPPSDWNMLDPEVLGWHLQTTPADAIARDLFALRRMVEPSAAELAAAHRSVAELSRIEAAYADMRAAARDERRLIDADLRFHLEILFATGNQFIGAFSALIHAAMLTTFELSWRGAEAAVIKDVRLEQHGHVVEAIRDGDTRRARQAMETLLDDSIGDVEGMLRPAAGGERGAASQ